MHDLNVLALTKTFEQSTGQEPPYLPFAGMAFGQYISTFILAQLLSRTGMTQTIYMKDIILKLFDSLYFDGTSRSKLLHQGLYPSYNIYKSKDGKKLCLAAIEEKFWTELISCFDLELNLQDRFDLSPKTRKKLEKRFANLESDEIRKKLKNKNICLTIANSEKDF